VHGRSRRPLVVAVPLEDVDLTVGQRVLVHRPKRRPGPWGQAVEFDSRFPRLVDHAAPDAAQLAAVIGARFVGGEQHEVGVAVDEHVAAIVAVDAKDWRPDIVLPGLHHPLGRIGLRPRRAVELVLEDVSAARIATWRLCR
jgi:hypothetical protein